MEAQLLEAQKMEALARLSGGVAHDFNTMLTAAIGCAEVARSALPEEAAARADVTEIVAIAHRGGALTRQLLFLARRQPVEPVLLRLDEQLRVSAGVIRRLLREDLDFVTRSMQDISQVRIDAGRSSRSSSTLP